MKSSLLTATACLAVVMLAATTASAQMYQSGYWDSYRGNGPDWSSYRNTSPQPYSHGTTHGNAYTQPYGFSYNTPDAGSHNTGQSGSYGDVYGTRDQSAHGQSYGNQYQTLPTMSSHPSGPGPAAQAQPSVPGPQPTPDAMQHGYGSVADTYDGSYEAGADGATYQTKPIQWMVSADLMYMTRVPGNTYPLLKVPSAVPPPAFSHETVALDVADFDFDYEPGWRIGASRMVCDGWGLEVGFMGMMDGWDYTTTMSGILELQGPGWSLGSDPTLVPPTAVAFRVLNTSEFYSGDLNLVRGVCDWATLRFGVRYIEFNDRLEVDELYTPLYNLLISTTDNNLIGAQFGADLKLLELKGCGAPGFGGGCGHGFGRGASYGGALGGAFGGTCGSTCGSTCGESCGSRCCRFRLNAMMNCGVFYNRVYHDPYSTFIGPPLLSEANEVALLGEMGLLAKYRLTDHVAIRAGYHIIALHGVALAPDQIATSDVVTETASTKMGSLIARPRRHIWS